MPIAEARKVLNQLPDRFAAEPEASALAVTRRGRPVLALMPWSLYHGIVETLEVLGDEARGKVCSTGGLPSKWINISQGWQLTPRNRAAPWSAN